MSWAWRSRGALARALVLAMLAACLAGAAGVGGAIRRHERAKASVADRMTEWHLRIAMELPPAQRAAWLQAARTNANAMMRALAMEHPVKP